MGKKIMLIDDSATMLMSVKSTLEMSEFEVETAGDGVEALGKIKGGYKPDLIITDVNMPNMGGLEFIEAARALPALKFTPILTLTTESETAAREKGKRLGATGWLVKPVGGADLVNVIKQVLPGA
jgi:two-component system, chemotaxis family, chemotaxis protein CheY